jgi:hypothetical protein
MVMSVLNKNPILKKARINERHGADIASAATVNLTMATGNLVDITGTATITAFTLPDGAERVVRFTGALTLTHGASLVLPGSANISTAAGDFAVFRGYASGVVRCVSYNRISGEPVLPIGWHLLSTITAAASGTVDIETTFNSSYEVYKLVVSDLVPNTSAADILMRIKTGGSYDTASNYKFHLAYPSGNATTYVGDASAPIASSIKICEATGGNVCFTLTIYNPAGTSLQKLFNWEGVYVNSGTHATMSYGAGLHTATAALTGVRIYPHSGNIASGKFRLYGLKKS